ncbi:MAG: hypothetical protein ACYTKD_31960 [Planctomycetota bacterium]|jgi:hypothetical protein
MIPEAEIEQYLEAHRVQIHWNQSSTRRKKHKEQYQLLQELLSWRRIYRSLVIEEYNGYPDNNLKRICRAHGIDPAEMEDG